MKSWSRFLAMALCLSLLLCLMGCSKAPASESSAPTAEPLSSQKIKALYSTACRALSAASDLSLTVDTYEIRVTGGETYTRCSSGIAAYTGIGTDDMEALVSEDLTLGSYEAQYVQSYIDGAAYCQVSDCSFTASMTADEFLDAQIPAILLDASLYGTLTCDSTSGASIITFSDAAALESWAVDSEYAQLISASGTVTLDDDGTMLKTTYHAEYTLSTTEYILDVSVSITTPNDLDVHSLQPEYPDNCSTLSYFQAPKMLLQVVGDVYTSQSMTGIATEAIYCAAADALRTQSVQIDTYSCDDDFMAKTDYTVSLTDYAGNTVSNTKTEIFRDGSYSYTANNSDPVTQSSITVQQMRAYCEDALLAALFTPNYLAGAELTDTGDFYYLTFQGTEAFAEDLYDKVYSILALDLDAYAASYTTEEATGYLTINKYTGLPTAVGLSLSRNHVIDKVSYKTTYQLDQSLTLSSTTAYKTITGEAEPETVPTETATPLFYKVTDEDGHILWLLGTIHIGDERTGFLPQTIYDAFDASDALAVEVNIDAFEEQVSSDPALLTQLAYAYYYSDGTRISDHLDAELYEAARTLILASGNNSASAPYMKISIWGNLIDNFYLQQDYTLTAEKGVDQRLLTMAAQQGKSILEIETGLSQIQMLAGYSEALQTALLSDTVSASLIDYNNDLRTLYELWCAGDEAALTEALTEDSSGLTEEELKLYEEYTKAMYTDRNAKMLSAAKIYLESGDTVFYAVGLAHLLGEDGLVNTLRAAGYTVEIVTYQ